MTDGQISYEEFGQRFFERAVTLERILGGVGTLAGQPINVGPMGVGPGRIAKVTATGAIGQAEATPLPGETISYRVVLPVQLTFDLNLQVDNHRFHADLEVPLVLSAHAAEPLSVVIDVTPPRPDEVGIEFRSEGLRAGLINRVADVEGELRRFVARYVSREINKPHVMKARVIDVAGAMDGAWARLAPKEKKESTVVHDLEAELERELLENEQLIEDLSD
jgi:hypothetical protein